MTIKSLHEILKEIMKEGRKSSGEWKALFGPTPDRFGSDLLIFHPIEGPIYQVRAYEKNPFQIDGLGTRLSQQVDKDFLNMIEKQRNQGSLGIVDLNYKILGKALQEGLKLDRIFLDALLGKKDQGIDYVNLGNSFKTRNQKPIPTITEEQKKLDREYKRLIQRDGKSTMYG